MTRRAIWAFTAAAAATGLAAVHLTAQAPTPPSRNRRVWTGTIDDRHTLLGATDTTPIRRPVQYYQDVNVSFRFVSEDDPARPGLSRWTSRRLSWNGFALSSSSIGGRECIGSGSVDLGPADDAGRLTSAQEAQLRIPCKDWSDPNVWSFIPVPNPKVRLPVIDMSMTNCAPTRRWTAAGVRYTLSVSGGDPQASFVVENPQDAPRPGKEYRIRAKANVPGRFKFVVNSSRFRGYATNADVDTAFFELYGLPDLRLKYGTHDPDLVFNPSDYEYEQTEWKTPSIDRGNYKWSVLESKENTSVTRAEATLTALDFGAFGELQAWFAPTCGGSWFAIDAEAGGSSVKIPRDADGNSMADSCKDASGYDDCARYRGMSPMADADPEPSSDAIPGDGFTAFEEYRGFVTQVGTNCDSALGVTHERTDPTTKDLFIHSPDPLLTTEARRFPHRSGLNVETVCPKYYDGNSSRLVNFTMHRSPGSGPRGERMTYVAQHGLYVVNEDLPGLFGRSDGFGPPWYVNKVIVDVRAIQDMVFDDPKLWDPLPYIKRTLAHELGHALGIRHHGQGNENKPIVLLNVPKCPLGTTEGTVEGTSGKACRAAGIAVRGGQNSGNAECPMKYIRWVWYVPPGNALKSVGNVDFTPNGSWSWRRSQELPGYLGRILRYERAIDKPGLDEFCASAAGTGINDLPGDRNHAGDAQTFRDENNFERGGGKCKAQLRIKDPQ